MDEQRIEAVFRAAQDGVMSRAGPFLHASDSDIQRASVQRAFLTGGKMLRPALTYMVNRNLYGNDDLAFDLGALVETVHRTSLVQDDMFDGDLMRRGLRTIHEEWGIPNALFAVNRGYGMSFKLLSNLRLYHPALIAEAGVELGRTIYEMTQGATKEMLHRTHIEQQYLNTIALKTASLFRLATVLPAIAFPNPSMKEYAGAYGHHLGMAYQLTDDLTDLMETRIRQTPCGDFLEGKPSLALTRMISGEPEQRAMIEGFLQRTATSAQIVELAEYLSRYVPHVTDAINEEIRLAQDELVMLPNNEYRDMLMDMPAYVVKRIWQELPVDDLSGYGSTGFTRPSWDQSSSSLGQTVADSSA